MVHLDSQFQVRLSWWERNDGATPEFAVAELPAADGAAEDWSERQTQSSPSGPTPETHFR